MLHKQQNLESVVGVIAAARWLWVAGGNEADELLDKGAEPQKNRRRRECGHRTRNPVTMVTNRSPKKPARTA